MCNLTQDRVFFVLWPVGFHIVSRQQTSHVFLGLRPKSLRPAYPRGGTSVMLLNWVYALMVKFNLTVPAPVFKVRSKPVDNCLGYSHLRLDGCGAFHPTTICNVVYIVCQNVSKFFMQLLSRLLNDGNHGTAHVSIASAPGD